MELTREHACGTVFLINAIVATKDGGQTRCPAQLHMRLCGEICHATSRASTGSCLEQSETDQLAINVSEGAIAREAINPKTVVNVAVSIKEIPLNICECQDCARDR